MSSKQATQFLFSNQEDFPNLLSSKHNAMRASVLFPRDIKRFQKTENGIFLFCGTRGWLYFGSLPFITGQNASFSTFTKWSWNNKTPPSMIDMSKTHLAIVLKDGSLYFWDQNYPFGILNTPCPVYIARYCVQKETLLLVCYGSGFLIWHRGNHNPMTNFCSNLFFIDAVSIYDGFVLLTNDHRAIVMTADETLLQEILPNVGINQIFRITDRLVLLVDIKNDFHFLYIEGPSVNTEQIVSCGHFTDDEIVSVSTDLRDSICYISTDSDIIYQFSFISGKSPQAIRETWKENSEYEGYSITQIFTLQISKDKFSKVFLSSIPNRNHPPKERSIQVITNKPLDVGSFYAILSAGNYDSAPLLRPGNTTSELSVCTGLPTNTLAIMAGDNYTYAYTASNDWYGGGKMENQLHRLPHMSHIKPKRLSYCSVSCLVQSDDTAKPMTYYLTENVNAAPILLDFPDDLIAMSVFRQSKVCLRLNQPGAFHTFGYGAPSHCLIDYELISISATRDGFVGTVKKQNAIIVFSAIGDSKIISISELVTPIKVYCSPEICCIVDGCKRPWKLDLTSGDISINWLGDAKGQAVSDVCLSPSACFLLMESGSIYALGNNSNCRLMMSHNRNVSTFQRCDLLDGFHVFFLAAARDRVLVSVSRIQKK